MSKRNLLNLILLIFILALIALVVVQPGKDKPLTAPTLTKLNSSDIQHIKIKRRNNEPDIELQKTAMGWLMLKPYRLPANKFRIDSVLKLLSAISLSQNNLNNLQQNKFGLEQPLASITFNNTTITFGHNKSLKNHRYVKINSTLHMIADTFYYQLMAKTESFINHKLLPEKSEIIKLQLPGMTLERKNTKWHVTPKADDFSADAINQLINEWQLSQAYDLNKIKIKSKINTDITIHLNNNKLLHFKIETNKDSFNLINPDSGIRYILSKDRENKLLKLSNPEQND